MILYGAMKFYKNQRNKLFALVGKENGKLLLEAVRRNITIMICENNTKTSIDGELYHILKGFGAKSVKNASITLENEGFIKGTFVTYFNEELKS